jgi:hypothetical protein
MAEHGERSQPPKSDPPCPDQKIDLEANSSSGKPSRQENDDNYGGTVVQLNSDWRVIRDNGGIQWILQQQQRSKSWRNCSYCGTRAGLIQSIKDHLLEEHLLRLDYYRREQASREAFDEAVTARELLKGGLVSRFGITPEAWAVIEALPDYFPKGELPTERQVA